MTDRRTSCWLSKPHIWFGEDKRWHMRRCRYSRQQVNPVNTNARAYDFIVRLNRKLKND